MMKSIHQQSPSPTSGISKMKHKHQLKIKKCFWPTTTAPPPTGSLQGHKFRSTKPMAITSSHLVLGVTSTVETRDFTVLLQTSAGLLFVYWLTNFVVPEIIMKDLQVDDANEDQKPGNEEGNTPSSK